MPGFDWNGNGSHDAFDSFMDMKVMSDSSETSDDVFSAFDDTSEDTLDYSGENVNVSRAELIGALGSASTYKSNSSSKSSTNFQDELKQNLRTPETVRQENAERTSNAMRYNAERTMREIKNVLLYKAKNAEYLTENGRTYLTCFCQMPYRFMRTRREDNGEQLRQNQKTFVLFRDPNLIYMTWNNYEIEPKYSNEYWQYITALKELAAKENISVESVVYNGRDKKWVAFPSRVRNDYSSGWTLCVKATTIISGQTQNNPVRTTPASSSSSNHISSQQQNKEQSSVEQNEPVSNGTVIAKSILAIGLCALAFVIMINVGGIIGALSLIGAAILGYKILSR